MSDPFDQFHADYVARQYRSERHYSLDASYPSDFCCNGDCMQGRLCPRQPRGPSARSWFLSDLTIALIFVGVCAAFALGAFN